MRVNSSTASLGWRLLPVVVGASATAVAATFVIALSKSGGAETPPPQAPPRVAEVVAAAPRWHIQVSPVGDGSGRTVAQRARYRAQRPEVKKVVRRVFDAWLLGRIPQRTIERFFVPAAAAEASKLDLLVDLGSAAIRSRGARIGVEGGVPRNAIAEVVIRGSTWIDRGTLWMHRGENGWKVIAFEIDRKARG